MAFIEVRTQYVVFGYNVYMQDVVVLHIITEEEMGCTV